MRVTVDDDTLHRLAAESAPTGELHRQVLGLRLVRTLIDLGVLEGESGDLGWVDVLDDPRSDDRFGWPFTNPPDEIHLRWPNPSPSRVPSSEQRLVVSPWALHSLLLGDWAELLLRDQRLRVPRACALVICDGVAEGPVGRDLLRLTSRLKVLDFPTQLYSHVLVCGLTDGCGVQEIEIRVSDSHEIETGFAIRSVNLTEPTVPAFVVVSLDQLVVPQPGIYTFQLRVLDVELAQIPLEVHGPSGPLPPEGAADRQSWTWDADVYFGERD